MKKLFAAALLFTAGFSMSAHAGFISGPKTFDGGKSVELQGLEWMPLTYTAGLSRNVVEGNNGFTDKFGGTWKKGDWRYATRKETETLLGSLWGGRYDGWSNDNLGGASAFINIFGATARTSNRATSAFMFGATGECDPSIRYTCFGLTETQHGSPNTVVASDKLNAWSNTISYRPGVHAGMGVFREDNGVSMGKHNGNSLAATYYGDAKIGSLLVRDVETVSSPAALSLFALGLCSLLLRRRKIAA